ncbi:MAG: nicotinate-nucleotide--dimethylbenzimidazole phosphoribosyltransferase [Anaerovoracaceae bacterium]|jgi:nicotinate-nucleotide--dimethylbenzimidazole phosphoribosyltransferase
MWKEQIEACLQGIRPADQQAMKAAAARQEKLAKPPGSLGQLENIAIRLAGITGSVVTMPQKPAVLIFSADNGVAAEGVSSAPQSVTMAQTINFTRKLTGVGALAGNFDVELLICDVGIAGTVPAELSVAETEALFQTETAKILDRKIARGTANLARGPAMRREQALKAMAAGLELARAAAAHGFDLLGVGEMGIGNTTTSTAVLAALLDLDPAEITGRGGGLTDAALEKKRQVIKDALHRLHREQPQADVTDILARLGGFDLAAMCGAFLGAAENRVPVVIDGYISAVAALCACRLQPQCRDALFASHRSVEPGAQRVIEALRLRPLLDLDLRLGEGSGCVLAFQIIRGAGAVMRDMATFEEAAIDDSYLEEIRAGGGRI